VNRFPSPTPPPQPSSSSYPLVDNRRRPPTLGREMDNMELTDRVVKLQSELRYTREQYDGQLRNLEALISEIATQSREALQDRNEDEDIRDKEMLLRDLLSIQVEMSKHHDMLARLVADHYQFFQNSQEKLDEFFHLVPNLIKQTWYHWIVIALLICSLVINGATTVYLMKHMLPVQPERKVNKASLVVWIWG